MKRTGLVFVVIAVCISWGAAIYGASWTPLANQPTFLNPPQDCAYWHNAKCENYDYSNSWGHVWNANLLTDGRILFELFAVNRYHERSVVEYTLTPDSNGSYVNGTWTQVASIPDAATESNPNGWAPLYLSSAVLPDGRVIYEGGEYSGINWDFLLSDRGAIYDPVANTWTDVPSPGFDNLYPAVPPVPRYPSPETSTFVSPIGDAQTVVLADGTFMLAGKMSKQAALLDPDTLSWTMTGANKADVNSEEGWTLLPNGKVLTVDCDLDYWFGLSSTFSPGNVELYDPKTGSWSSVGHTPVQLTHFPEGETGPAILMPNGMVWLTGDSSATALYDSDRNELTPGPTLPNVTYHYPNGYFYPGGGDYTYQATANDSSAAPLPDGSVLLAVNDSLSGPTKFVRFDGEHMTVEPDIPDAAFINVANLLVLPTGQVLEYEWNSDIEIYTPDPARSRPWWAPKGLSVPPVVSAGGTYELSGLYLNGVSQGGNTGDDHQMATNYPLVRITNLATHHVFYCRTHDFSSMGVTIHKHVTAKFDVPAGVEKGRSQLEVVTNGVASTPRPILVK